MNTDFDFQIGHDHLICQDYALAGGKLCDASPFDAFAIVSDGCSASPHVDVGARMLGLAARECLSLVPELDYKSFGEEVLRKASGIFMAYGWLNRQALDATLLALTVKGDHARVLIYGDGVFFHKSEAGLYALRVELTSGAPDYLSYNLDSDRKRQYIDMSTKDNEKKVLEIKDEQGTGKFEYDPFAPVIILRTVKPGDILAVCSDGVGSFRRADNTGIDWLDMADEFVGFKNTNGVFVKRRFAALKRKCLKEGMTHSDDISIASIIV